MVATRGLAPALAESRRLDREEPVVEERFSRTEAALEAAQAEAQAFQDPIYLERLRRARESGGPTRSQ